jgi:hypothetical protein
VESELAAVFVDFYAQKKQKGTFKSQVESSFVKDRLAMVLLLQPNPWLWVRQGCSRSPYQA